MKSDKMMSQSPIVSTSSKVKDHPKNKLTLGDIEPLISKSVSLMITSSNIIESV